MVVRFGMCVFSRRMMDENYLDLLFGSTYIGTGTIFREGSVGFPIHIKPLSPVIGMQGHFVFRGPSASITSAPTDDKCLLVGMVSISAGTF